MLQVGTYIGERLLYTPSIGYCILVAGLVAGLAGDSLPGILLLWRQSPGLSTCAVISGTPPTVTARELPLQNLAKSEELSSTPHDMFPVRQGSC